MLIQRGPTAEAGLAEAGAGLAEAVTGLEEAVTVAGPVTAEAEATAGRVTEAEWATEQVLVSATATLTAQFQPMVLAPQLPDIEGPVTMGMPSRPTAAQAI